MLRSILDLGDVWVEEIMTHRRNVTMIDIAQPPEEVLTHVMDAPFTRIPLYKGEQEEIVGVLHAKSLLRAVRAGEGVESLDVQSIAADPWFIPSTTLLDQLQAPGTAGTLRARGG